MEKSSVQYEKLNKKVLELQKRPERYELFVAGSTSGLWDWDIQSDEIYYSDRFKELLSYVPEDFSNSPDEFWKRLHADDFKLVERAITAHLEKRVPYIIDYRLRNKSGEYLWFHARGQALWNEKGIATRMSGSIADITQRKKAESDLKLSKERYELAARGSAAGIWDWDMVTGNFYFSEQLQKLLGYEPGEFKDSLEDLWDRMHPDDVEATQLDLDLHLKKQKTQHLVESRMRTKSGEYRWFQASSKAVWDDNDKPIRLAGSFIDINDRKNAQEKIINSEERFRQLMEQSPLAMEILAPDGKINEVNTAWKKLWNVSDEEAAETIEKYNMLTDPQLEKLGVMDEVKKAFKGKHIILSPVKYDTGQTKDDFDIKQLKSFRSPWTQCHLNSVKNAEGNIVYVVNTYVDITDLKEAQETLAKSETRYRNLVEHSPLSVAVLTPDGKITQVNAAWKKLWGFNDKEAAQLMANYNYFDDKQIKDLGHAPLLERASKGESIIMPLIEYELKHTMEDLELGDIVSASHIRWIQTHVYSIKNANEEIDSVVGINMDLTELKKAEKEAQQQRDILARLDRTSSMGQLTGSIAHELNQPLTGILSNAQAIELMIKSGKWKEEVLMEILSDIVNDAKRGGEVIRNLRDLYRGQEVQFNPFNINEIITDTLKILHSELIFHHVAINVKPDSSVPILKGNQIQIQQVLVNLIMNAIQAMSAIEKNTRQLHILTTHDRNEVKTWVKDSGRGINKDKIARIFEPLATWKPGGTGMGLAISNSIIESHGGRMFAENHPEGGAIVGFTLPLNKMDLKKND